VLNVPELATFSSEQSRHIKCMQTPDLGNLGECPEGSVQFVSGRRIILFLGPEIKRASADRGWAIGALWIEQGEAYGLYDIEAPWKGTLTTYGTEASVRDRVANVAREKEGLAKALAISDVEARIQALRPFTLSRVDYTATVASVEIEALKKAQALGPKPPDLKAIPLLECANDCAGAFAGILLQRELAFWRERASDLKIGWWTTMRDDESLPYRRHFSSTLKALGALETTRHRESKETVKKLRRYFLSTPQLSDLRLIIEACDSFLSGIKP
jgi:hypothetical protein